MKPLFLLLLSLCPLLAQADSFVPDLGDSPKNATTGYMIGQGLVLGGIVFAGKAFLDANKAERVDWAPGVFLFAASLLIHSYYWQEGGRNASLAWQEEGLETAGISLGIAL